MFSQIKKNTDLYNKIDDDENNLIFHLISNFISTNLLCDEAKGEELCLTYINNL